MSDSDQNVAHLAVAGAWADITGCLSDRKSRLYDEIRNYPTPIAGCDQQFNYLLEQQAAVARELAFAMTCVDGSPAQHDPLALLDDFIKSSTSIDEADKQSLRARLSGIVA